MIGTGEFPTRALRQRQVPQRRRRGSTGHIGYPGLPRGFDRDDTQVGDVLLDTGSGERSLGDLSRDLE